jgi:protein-tyrosine phosphatase
MASKVDLLMRHADRHEAIDVPDPWFGSARDFVEAFDMIEAGVDGLLQRLMMARA